jgi:periplasmic protein TonB
MTMKTELILKSDVLDIIFEHRNKAYGAYNLRKFYDNRLMKSLAVMLVVVVVLSAFTFIPKAKVTKEDDGLIATYCQIIPDVKEKEPVEKPKEQPVKKKVPTVQFTKPLVVDNLTPVKPLDAITDSVTIATVTDPGKPGDIATVGDDPVDVTDGGKGKEPVKDIVDINTPTETAEVMPSYPGGMNALIKFLQRNLTNPRDMEEGEEVSVKMRFVVGYDGKLKSFVTVQDGGEEFNKEVIRVLKKMPDWVPGKSKGQNVSVYYTIPVKFVVGN